MSVFYPTRLEKHISDIKPTLLESLNVNTLVLDVDNTLTTHNHPTPDDRAMAWLEEMKALGYKLVILSNNNSGRVEPFARMLGLDFTANAMKPLTKGFRETAGRLGVQPRDMVMVGDQLFTDILGANLYGCKSILVEPMEAEDDWGFRLKRRLEQGILRRWERKIIQNNIGK